MNILYTISLISVPALVSGSIIYLILRQKDHQYLEEATKSREMKLKAAREKEKEMMSEVKEREKEIISLAEEECNERLKVLKQHEERLNNRENALEKKQEEVKKIEGLYRTTEQNIKKIGQDITIIHDQEKQALEKITNISQIEAKEILLTNTSEQAGKDYSNRIKRLGEYLSEEEERQSSDLITSIIQRYTLVTSRESSSTAVIFESAKVKNRVLGKKEEVLEKLLNMLEADLTFEVEDNTLHIFGHHLIKRHIAKLILQSRSVK